ATTGAGLLGEEDGVHLLVLHPVDLRQFGLPEALDRVDVQHVAAVRLLVPVRVRGRALLVEVGVVRLPTAPTAAEDLAGAVAATEQDQRHRNDQPDDPAAATAAADRDDPAEAAPAAATPLVLDLPGIDLGVLIEIHEAEGT